MPGQTETNFRTSLSLRGANSLSRFRQAAVRASSPRAGCRRLCLWNCKLCSYTCMHSSFTEKRSSSEVPVEFCSPWMSLGSHFHDPGNLNINWKPTGQSVSSYRFKFHGTVFPRRAKLGMDFAAGATRSWHRSTRRGLAMQGF